MIETQFWYKDKNNWKIKVVWILEKILQVDDNDSNYDDITKLLSHSNLPVLDSWLKKCPKWKKSKPHKHLIKARKNWNSVSISSCESLKIKAVLNIFLTREDSKVYISFSFEIFFLPKWNHQHFSHSVGDNGQRDIFSSSSISVSSVSYFIASLQISEVEIIVELSPFENITTIRKINRPIPTQGWSMGYWKWCCLKWWWCGYTAAASYCCVVIYSEAW